MWPFSQPNWKSIAASKQQTRQELVDEALTTLATTSADSSTDQYTRASASEIVKNIESGQWTASDVMEAYIIRAGTVQRLHNPITEVLFSDALTRAKALDEEFQKSGTIVGPLHGVPISIKDQYDIEGHDSSIGFSAWCNSPKRSDAAVVEAVRRAGGIVICKTNVPQTMLNFECSNPVWGVTSNPWNDQYTCGGSSGGEGAMLAADASALGVGSDVGGSLRIPALYCGVYSLKPGAGRISRRGACSSNPGFDAIPVTPGPMGRTVADVKLLSRVLFNCTPANTYEGIAPVPFRVVQVPKKLKIGYYFEDKFVRTSPANRRAVQETVDALRLAGHELVEFDLPFGPRSIQIFVSLTSGDGYRTLRSPSGSDPIEKNLFLITLGPSLYSWVRTTAAWVVRNILGDRLFADTFARSKPSNVGEYWSYNAQKNQMIREFYEEVWDRYQFDAIIAPGMVAPALPHGGTTRLSPLANGTFFYNVVDSPVGIVPVTRVDPTKDALPSDWHATSNGIGSLILNDLVYGAPGVTGIYDVNKMKGLPVGVQVVGRHWEDERILEIMDIVDKVLPKRNFGPGSWSPPQTEK
ncbi:related to amidase (acetamidase) [Serendipita indica DSM 11827]|uniref:amidase n=1 Tax=Serendipita indica (strain DSM 11827) TaxID=1109443 RepID=G4TGJ7_SERID|nr:related to amidase (acetamidase) [Serendipita indica DSM 11827]